MLFVQPEHYSKDSFFTTTMIGSRPGTFSALVAALLLRGTSGLEAPERCWDNITAIYEEHLKFQPEGSTNEYVICPGTYDIGYQYGNGECCENGQYPLIARSNTHYRCGGSSSSCVLAGGDTHVLINDAIFGEGLENAIIEGFTFRSPRRSTSFAASPGSVRFVDCTFEVR